MEGNGFTTWLDLTYEVYRSCSSLEPYRDAVLLHSQSSRPSSFRTEICHRSRSTSEVCELAEVRDLSPSSPASRKEAFMPHGMGFRSWTAPRLALVWAFLLGFHHGTQGV